MPLEGFLVKVIRKGEYLWQTIEVLEVSFADLVVPEKCSSMKVSKFRKFFITYCKMKINFKFLLFYSNC